MEIMKKINNLNTLEAEAIYIFREVVSEFSNPVMLYSIGKDSSVMLHLAKKAFFPAEIPFPIMHIDTNWKFKEMIQFRDNIAKKNKIDLIVYQNPEGIKNNINPFDHGTEKYTNIMKTEALKQALSYYGFDAAFGGARRDEEKSRAKERFFSFRNKDHRWDPKQQRPELWDIFNTKINKGESIRVFPLSNWTEIDIWQYIQRENIEVVPLYYSKIRPVVKRDDQLIMIDDERFVLNYNEIPTYKMIRFRTLGCYPLTAAIESNAQNIEDIISETLSSKFSERSGRIIDFDCNSSMEKKKIEGYF